MTKEELVTHLRKLRKAMKKPECQNIAGTKLTLDVACRNMMTHTGASIVDIFRYASYNPSRAIGLDDRDEIAVGKQADLVIVDHNIQVKTVIFQGKPIA